MPRIYVYKISNCCFVSRLYNCAAIQTSNIQTTIKTKPNFMELPLHLLPGFFFNHTAKARLLNFRNKPVFIYCNTGEDINANNTCNPENISSLF